MENRENKGVGVNNRWRFLLLALGGLALLGALWGGLVRLGIGLPLPRVTLPAAHGPLMISGLLGTVIGLERAVALGARWSYLAPLLAGAGSLALLEGFPAGRLLMLLSSLVLLVIFVIIIRSQLAHFTITMGIGALAWLVGNAFWLSGWPIPAVVPWWAGFLVLTIAGERLEMSRLLRYTPTVQFAFYLSGSLFLSGVILSIIFYDIGVRLMGLGLIAMTLWLFQYDIARRTVRQKGLTRFIAVSLLSGYVWLGVSGLLALFAGGVMSGPVYDAMLHALFLGFVFAMIFGHAPIIFPAVIGIPIYFRPSFYSHLALLHVSLLLRVAGDLSGWLPGRQWGGALNALALLLFLFNTIRSARGSIAPPA